MKDFRHTLIDRKLFYPIHRPHLVSTARRWKSFHSLTHQIILFLLFCTNSFRINKIHSFIHMILFTEKKPPLKTFEDVQALLSQGKKREVKLLLRDNAWPINSTIRAQLWPTICSQHQVGKSMLEGYYWDMVNQVWDCIIINELRTLSNKLYLNRFDSWEIKYLFPLNHQQWNVHSKVAHSNRIFGCDFNAMYSEINLISK